MDTSPFAYEHVLRAMRRKPASFSKAGAGAMEAQSFENRLARFGPLVWFYHLFLRLTFGVKANGKAGCTIEERQTQSRRQRHLNTYMDTHARFPVARRVSALFWRLMRGMTPGQQMEFEARLSGLGRMRIYGMRTRRGLVRLRRPQMVRYAHGWWRMPDVSRTARGLWDAQLPDN